MLDVQLLRNDLDGVAKRLATGTLAEFSRAMDTGRAELEAQRQALAEKEEAVARDAASWAQMTASEKANASAMRTQMEAAQAEALRHRQQLERIATEAGVDPNALFERSLRISSERAFKTIWRVMLRFTSDEALVARTAMIYSRTRDTGELSSRVIAPGRAEVTLRSYPGASMRTLRD